MSLYFRNPTGFVPYCYPHKVLYYNTARFCTVNIRVNPKFKATLIKQCSVFKIRIQLEAVVKVYPVINT